MSYPPFNRAYENVAPLIARVILGGALLLGAFYKIPGSESFNMMVEMTGAVGVPLPQIAVTLAFILELATGLMLILGYHARIAAALLIPFLVLVTVLFNMMPKPEDPMSISGFISHLIYIALLCYISVYGAKHFALKRD